MNQGGISLKELLVVIVLIGLLSAIVLHWIGAVQRSPDSSPQISAEEAFWAEQKARVIEAKQTEAEYQQAFSKMEIFCGKGNVWEGSGHGAGRVFGCKDYKTVDLPASTTPLEAGKVTEYDIGGAGSNNAPLVTHPPHAGQGQLITPY